MDVFHYSYPGAIQNLIVRALFVRKILELPKKETEDPEDALSP